MQSTAAHITDKFGGTTSKLKSHCRIIPGVGANHIERLRNPKFSGWNPRQSINSSLGIKPSISWAESVYYIDNDFLAYQILNDLLRNHKRIVQLAYTKTGYDLDNPHKIIVEALNLAMVKWLKEMDKLTINLEYVNSPIVKMSYSEKIGYHISFGTFIYPFYPVIFHIQEKPRGEKNKLSYEFKRNMLKGIANAYHLDEIHYSFEIELANLEDYEDEDVKSYGRELEKSKTKIEKYFDLEFNPQISIPEEYEEEEKILAQTILNQLNEMILMHEIIEFEGVEDMDKHFESHINEQTIAFADLCTLTHETIEQAIRASFDSDMVVPNVYYSKIEDSIKITKLATSLMSNLIKFFYE